jgi:hypothetical protein
MVVFNFVTAFIDAVIAKRAVIKIKRFIVKLLVLIGLFWCKDKYIFQYAQNNIDKNA